MTPQASLLNTLKQSLNRSSESPLLSLPEHLLNLRKVCQSHDSDVHDIAEQVIQDPGFTSYLLKLSNSAFYALGRESCANITDSLRRIGIRAVGQISVLYALRGLHQIDDAPDEFVQLMRKNWNKSWALAQDAANLCQQMREQGLSAARRVDISDIMTAAVLYNSGSLACYTQAILMYNDGIRLQGDYVQAVAESMQLALLHEILEFLGYPEADKKALVEGAAINTALHFSDFVHAARLKQINASDAAETLIERLTEVELWQEA